MTIALVTGAHTATNTTTSPAIDTTGATLIVIAAEEDTGSGRTWTAPSDNKSNTFLPLTATTLAGSGNDVRLYYCANPTVGSGHTFTNNMTEFSTQGFFSCISVAAFSGVATTTPLDQETAHQTGGGPFSVQPGSVTPSEDNELIVTGAAIDTSKTYTINGGYTILDVGTATGNNTIWLAYLVQTSAAATNPTWTLSAQNSGGVAAAIATFKASAAAPPGQPTGKRAGGVEFSASSPYRHAQGMRGW